ncbi:MAG: B12-binding domain-containing radical SAM protein [Acetobacteraceae bacterium]|nr:B12-binding domain-containing radical SAM protein [Acetobacteraceae bacterium]
MTLRVALATVHYDGPGAVFPRTECLGLGYLAAVLRRHGFQAIIIDAQALELDEASLSRRLLNAGAGVVGISLSHATVDAAYRVFAAVKTRSPDTITLAGGHHATFAADEVLRECPHLDGVVRGEGEMVFLELCRWIQGGSPDYSKIKGVWWKAGNSVIKNPDALPVPNLDELPPPARDTLDALVLDNKEATVALLTSRGCQGACSFCSSAAFHRLGGGRAWRAHSPDRVVRDMLHLARTYRLSPLRPLFVSDDDFIGPPPDGLERADGIASALLSQRDRVWFECDARADAFCRSNRPVLRRLASAGLSSAFVGLESFSAAGLKRLGKGLSPRVNRRAIREMDRLGILRPAVGYIMFHPWVRAGEIMQSARLLARIGQLTAYSLLSQAQAFPGTPLRRRLAAEGLLRAKRHTDVTGYEFRDASVGELVRTLEGLLEPRWRQEVLELDMRSGSCWYRADLLWRALQQAGITTPSLAASRGQVAELRRRANEANLRFLRALLRRGPDEPRIALHQWWGTLYDIQEEAQLALCRLYEAADGALNEPATALDNSGGGSASEQTSSGGPGKPTGSRCRVS